ncbi:Tryptophan synthase alpha chain [Myxococcus hansupus]|uniref:Tryptophan synthase alpha chain n=1 Tax=Pseudomyxococcus hansupus TaxID=1297742 RepID=A0A0H4X5N5_9BACT|nr:MopE-related protein [Myxococcus hansupus]AKQ69188.1 Tryptophan synthase alpha chain [Myxococcus hansupus]
MKTFESRLLALCGGLILALGAAACVVEFPDDVPYTCTETADCGGDGYVCTSLPNDGPRYCCLPDPAEVCNGLDDDCDGQVDNLDTPCYPGPAGTLDVGVCRTGDSVCAADRSTVCVGAVVPGTEICNGLDDDCDGDVDEDFDLKTDPVHCGVCNNACTFAQDCVNGECVRRQELDCANGVDDDRDGFTDCQDREDCDDQSCGAECVCRNGSKTEMNCANGLDDDGDGLIDCADRADCPTTTVCQREDGAPGQCQVNGVCL